MATVLGEPTAVAASHRRSQGARRGAARGRAAERRRRDLRSAPKRRRACAPGSRDSGRGGAGHALHLVSCVDFDSRIEQHADQNHIPLLSRHVQWRHSALQEDHSGPILSGEVWPLRIPEEQPPRRSSSSAACFVQRITVDSHAAENPCCSKPTHPRFGCFGRFLFATEVWKVKQLGVHNGHMTRMASNMRTVCSSLCTPTDVSNNLSREVAGLYTFNSSRL